MRAIRTIALTIAGLAAALLAYSFVESRRLHVVAREFESSRLPKSFDGTRVVFLTDVHAGPYYGAEQLRGLVARVNALEPDIVLLGGDNVGGGSGSGAGMFYPAAARIEAPLGKFAVLGNHDAWEGSDEARRGLREAGFTLLENTAVVVTRDGGSIDIAGLEDLWTGHPDARAAARETHGGFALLMVHNPDVFHTELPATPGVWDLALGGHTHGGQVTLFGKFAPFEHSTFGNRYRTGWRTEGGTPILVSNGVGTVTAPLRLFARPQLHVIVLRCP